ncbi:TPA: hypothetical protein ACPJ0Q_004656 [Vibrio diabolicus]
MWKQPSETLKYLKGLDSTENLSKLYSLSRAFSNAFYGDDYNAAPDWSDALVFTKSTEKLLKKHFPKEMEVKDPDFFLATFGYFYHHKLFFDHSKCDLEKIEKLLNSEIIKGEIKFPHRFGNELYKKYNDLYEKPKKYLNIDDSLTLLSDTPNGIYQCGHYLLGPLGNIYIEQHRSVYPSLALPMWHCDGVNCNITHPAMLVPDQNVKVVNYHSQIDSRLSNDLSGRTDWKTSFINFERSGSVVRKDYAFLLETLCDTITGDELSALALHALNGSKKDYLRSILKTSKTTCKLERNRSEYIVSNLSNEQKLQLILCLDDAIIIEYIDELISNNTICIPASEIRTPKFVSSNRSSNLPCQISCLGIRSRMSVPMMYLVSIIMSGYEKNNLESDLEWKLREFSGKSRKDALVSYIQKNGPEHTIQNLILASSTLTKYVCSVVKLSQNLVHESSKLSINRLMWKIGYNPAQYDDLLSRLHKRLSNFEDQLTELDQISSEDDRDRIRSSGVNLFVSIEEYLDRLISYNTWLLAHDHYIKGKFKFDINEARVCVRDILDNDNDINWSIKGDNSLGVLLHYLSLLMSWVDSLADKPREHLLRDDELIPRFIYQDLIPFPFIHTQAWADYDIGQIDSYKLELESIVNQINRSKLAEVRNGIDHYRDQNSFPSLDTMTACVLRLKKAISRSDVNRFFPKHYVLKSTIKNEFNIIEYELSDYRDRRLTIYGPSLVTGIPSVNNTKSVIVAPCNLLGIPNSTMTFTLKEPSEYSKYWEGYPIKKKSN